MWMSKRCRRMMAERDEANSSLRHMMDENTELVKKLRATEDQLAFAHNEYARLCRNVEEEIKKCNKSYEDIVKAFAYFSARLHQQGIYHKDYSPGNILFDKQADGSIRFELVDINRMEFGQTVGIDKACRNFCRLWGKQDFFELLAAEYATARGWDAQQVRRLIIRYWKRFWRHRK